MLVARQALRCAQDRVSALPSSLPSTSPGRPSVSAGGLHRSPQALPADAAPACWVPLPSPAGGPSAPQQSQPGPCPWSGPHRNSRPGGRCRDPEGQAPRSQGAPAASPLPESAGHGGGTGAPTRLPGAPKGAALGPPGAPGAEALGPPGARGPLGPHQLLPLRLTASPALHRHPV